MKLCAGSLKSRCCLWMLTPLVLLCADRCMSNFRVSIGDTPSELFVRFDGPKESPYEGGQWKVRLSIL
jgi:hypothetical protein